MLSSLRRTSVVALALSSAACPAAPSSAPDASAPSAAVAPVTAAPDAGAAQRPAPPLQEATRAEAEDGLARLEKWVKPGASDPKNAWALAHGVVAFGKDLEASDGRLAIDVFVSDYLEVSKVAGRTTFSFPEARDGVPVEPHRDLLVKTLLEADVPLERSFKTHAGGKVTLRELVAGIERTFSFPTEEKGWRNYAWTANALLRANREKGRVDAPSGPIPLPVLADRTIGWLEHEQGFLEPLLGHPEALEKKRQGIYAHHCGGLHFVQTADLAAASVKDPNLVARARHQLDLVLFRWDAERRIYHEMLAQQPKYHWLLLVQQLKFYGHVLETFALAHDEGLIEADPVLSKKMRQLTGDLLDTVLQLEPAYLRQEAVGELVPQTRYDLIGDGCHAVRGLRRALVAFFAT